MPISIIITGAFVSIKIGKWSPDVYDSKSHFQKSISKTLKEKIDELKKVLENYDMKPAS